MWKPAWGQPALLRGVCRLKKHSRRQLNADAKMLLRPLQALSATALIRQDMQTHHFALRPAHDVQAERALSPIALRSAHHDRRSRRFPSTNRDEVSTPDAHAHPCLKCPELSCDVPCLGEQVPMSIARPRIV